MSFLKFYFWIVPIFFTAVDVHLNAYVYYCRKRKTIVKIKLTYFAIRIDFSKIVASKNQLTCFAIRIAFSKILSYQKNMSVWFLWLSSFSHIVNFESESLSLYSSHCRNVCMHVHSLQLLRVSSLHNFKLMS